MKAVETAPHEFSANYVFDDYGLTPFFACDRQVKDGEGSVTATFNAHGETWTARLYYQDSGIVHPGPTNPQGTTFAIENLREYRIAVEAEDDPTGQKSLNLHLAPRWQGMEVENSKGETSEFSVPDAITEAVNVKVSGSNIPFHHYHELLAGAFGAVGVNRHYFARPHETSNVRDAEMYVRLHRDESGPVHAREGPIAQLGHLLESDRDGYRKVVQNDRDEAGRQLAGYYHTVTLGSDRIRSAFPKHELPKEMKHYYAREANSKDADDALAHPKLGASYQVNRWDETLGVGADDLAQLEDELTSAVLSLLAESGIETNPELGAPFVEDPYFAGEATDYEDDPVQSLDLTELESHQENVVIQHLADGFSPVEWESLETLVTDGGNVSPANIADQNGRHVDSVRKALGRIPELVEHSYGEVSLRSDYIAEMVSDAVNEARDAVRRAVDAGAKARLAAERGHDFETSALMAFCAKHGIDVNGKHDARLRLRMARENVSTKLQRLERLWTDSGRESERLREARLLFEDGSAATVWRHL